MQRLNAKKITELRGKFERRKQTVVQYLQQPHKKTDDKKVKKGNYWGATKTYIR